MAAQSVVEDSTPTKHSVHVDWFRREGDPVGGTIFVKPATDDGTTPQPAAERAAKAEASQ